MPSESARINSIPIPQCCEEQRARPTIMAMIDCYGDDNYDPDNPEADWEPDTATLTPIWYVACLETFDRARFRENRDARPTNEPKFCPYCGAKLPKLVRKKKPPKRLCRITDGGYYCDTCKERLDACACYPPEAGWEIEK